MKCKPRGRSQPQPMSIDEIDALLDASDSDDSPLYLHAALATYDGEDQFGNRICNIKNHFIDSVMQSRDHTNLEKVIFGMVTGNRLLQHNLDSQIAEVILSTCVIKRINDNNLDFLMDKKGKKLLKKFGLMKRFDELAEEQSSKNRYHIDYTDKFQRYVWDSERLANSELVHWKLLYLTAPRFEVLLTPGRQLVRHTSKKVLRGIINGKSKQSAMDYISAQLKMPARKMTRLFRAHPGLTPLTPCVRKYGYIAMFFMLEFDGDILAELLSRGERDRLISWVNVICANRVRELQIFVRTSHISPREFGIRMAKNFARISKTCDKSTAKQKAYEATKKEISDEGRDDLKMAKVVSIKQGRENKAAMKHSLVFGENDVSLAEPDEICEDEAQADEEARGVVRESDRQRRFFDEMEADFMEFHEQMKRHYTTLRTLQVQYGMQGQPPWDTETFSQADKNLYDNTMQQVVATSQSRIYAMISWADRYFENENVAQSEFVHPGFGNIGKHQHREMRFVSEINDRGEAKDIVRKYNKFVADMCKRYKMKEFDASKLNDSDVRENDYWFSKFQSAEAWLNAHPQGVFESIGSYIGEKFGDVADGFATGFLDRMQTLYSNFNIGHRIKSLFSLLIVTLITDRINAFLALLTMTIIELDPDNWHQYVLGYGGIMLMHRVFAEPEYGYGPAPHPRYEDEDEAQAAFDKFIPFVGKLFGQSGTFTSYAKSIILKAQLWSASVSLITNVKNVISWFCRYLFNYDPFCSAYGELYKLVCESVDAVTSSASIWEKHIESSQATRDLIIYHLNVLRTGWKLESYLKRAQAERLRLALKRLTDLEPAVLAANNAYDCLTAPVGLMMTGGTGVGKTSTLTNLNRILTEIWDYEPSKTSMYSKPVTSDYWDSYGMTMRDEETGKNHGTLMVFFDDAFQAKDNQVRGQTADVIVRMCAPTSRPLDMAHLSNKGQVYFNAPLLAVTTNVPAFTESNLGIESPEAFVRRFHIWVEPHKHTTDPNEEVYVIKGLHSSLRKKHNLKVKDVISFNVLCVLVCSMRDENVKAGNLLDAETISETVSFVRQRVNTHLKFEGDINTDDDVSASEDIAQAEQDKAKSDEDFEKAVHNLKQARDRQPRFSGKLQDPTNPETMLDQDVDQEDVMDEVDFDHTGDDETLFKHDKDHEPPRRWRQFIEDNKFGVATAFFVSALVIGYGCYKSMSGEEDAQYERRSARPRRAKQKFMSSNRHSNKAQADIVPSIKGGLERISKALAVVEIEYDDVIARQNAVWLDGRGRLLMCSHAVPEHDFRIVVYSHYLRYGKGVFTFRSDEVLDPNKYQVQSVTRFGVDYVMIQLNANFCYPATSISKYIVSNEESLEQLCPGEGFLVSAYVGETLKSTWVEEIHISAGDKTSYVVNGKKYTHVKSLFYDAETETGDCGSIVVALTRHNGVRIVGIHMARSTTSGIAKAQVLTSAILDEIMSDEAQFRLVKVTPTLGGQTHIMETGLTQVGSLDDESGMYHRMNSRSTYHKSPMFECFGPHTMEPAVLKGTNSEGKSVLDLALMKQRGFNFVCGGEDLLEEASSALRTYYPIMPNHGPLTPHQAINGAFGTPKLPINTSAGMMPGMKSKKLDWLEENVMENGEKIYTPKPELEVLLDELHTSFKDDYSRPLVLFGANLKNEKRDIARVRAMKTRLFMAAPLPFVVAIRQWFLRCSVYIEHLYAGCPIKCGINVHGDDWKVLYEELSKPGGTLWCGDFSRFDQSIPERLMERACRFLVETCGSTHVQERLNALRDVINPHFVIGKRVYSALGMNPSGNPLTTIINSVVQYLALYSAIKLICERENIVFNMLDCKFCLYGDDNVVWVPCENFPVAKMREVLQELFGMDYTSADKKDDIVSMPIEDVTFLGRKFRFNGGHCDAPLELDRVREILYWFQGPRSTRNNVLCAQIESFCIEMSHHGQEAFERDVARLRQHSFVAKLDSTMLSPIKWKSYFEIVNDRFCGRIQYNDSDSVYTPVTWQGAVVSSNDACEDIPQADIVKMELYTKSKSQDERTGGSDAGNEDERELRITEDTENIEQIAFDDTVVHDEEEFEGDNGTVIFNYPLPFEEFTLPGTLDRPYLVDTFTFSASNAQNDVLANYYFPEVLFASDFLRSKLDGFHFFQCDHFEITFRLNATQFSAGLIVAAYRPVPTVNSTGLPNNAVDLCGWPHSLISVSSEEISSLTIPWVYVNPSYDLNKGLADFDNAVPLGSQSALGQLKISCLMPLVSATGDLPQSITVTVWARMVGARCYVPDPAESVTRNAVKLARKHGVNIAHDGGARNSVKKHLEYVRCRVVDKLGVEEGTLRYQQYLKEEETDPIGAFLRLATSGGVEVYTDKAQSLMAAVGEIGKGIASTLATTMATEAVKSSTSGTEATRGPSRGKNKKSLLENIPIIGGLVTLGKNTLHSLGLQRPTDVSTTGKKVLSYDAHMERSAGVDSVARLMPSVDGYVATDPAFAGSNRDENSLIEMAMTPSVVRMWEFDSVSTSHSLLLSPSVSYEEDSVTYPSILQSTARMFRLWRGSIKVLLYVVSAKNVSGRLKLTFNTSDSASSGGLTQWDMYSQVIDFKGDTVHKVVFPFANARAHLKYEDSIGMMDLEMLTAINAPGNTDFPVRVMVYMAAAEDFDFRLPVPLGNLFVAMDTPGEDDGENVAQFHVRHAFLESDDWTAIHPNATLSRVDGISNPDKMMSIKDLLGYYQVIYARNHYSLDPPSRNIQITTNGYWPHTGLYPRSRDTNGALIPYNYMEHLKWMFCLWRGSFRYKIVATPANGMIHSVQLGCTDWESSTTGTYEHGLLQNPAPMTMFDSSYRTMADIEVPYVTPVIAMPTQSGSDQVSRMCELATCVVPQLEINLTRTFLDLQGGHGYECFVSIYAAVGDDFRFGFLHSPGPRAAGTTGRYFQGSTRGTKLQDGSFPLS